MRMAKLGEQTSAGRITEEVAVLDEPNFRVVWRAIAQTDGQVRDQLVWDRRGKNFSSLVAVTPQDEIVLVRESKYGQMDIFTSVPTGAIKEGETPEQAARRRLLEEAGYEVDQVKPLRKRTIVDSPDKSDGGAHYPFIGFDARKISEPQGGREVVLLKREQAQRAVDGELAEIEGVRLDVAMMMVIVTGALRYLDLRDQQK